MTTLDQAGSTATDCHQRCIGHPSAPRSAEDALDPLTSPIPHLAYSESMSGRGMTLGAASLVLLVVLSHGGGMAWLSSGQLH